MKTTFRILTCLLAASAPAVALAQTGTAGQTPPPAAPAAAPAVEEESYPVSASFGLRYRLNHANMVETESEEANFGYQQATLSVELGYEIIESLSASASVAVAKELSESYNRPGSVNSATRRSTELSDVGLSLDWSDFYTIPVADIGLSAGLGLSLPTSKASRAAGVILSVSPGLSASWSLGDFSTSLGISYGYYVNENPTQQIDCENLPHQCEVAGKDFGSPLGLHEISGSLSLGYKITKKLSTSVGYTLGNTYGAVEFPEDDLTVPYAQTGTQSGTGYHLGTVSLSYKLPSKTSLGLGMGTSRDFYSADGKHVTFPFFDLDSDLHHRTYYQFSISQSL